MTNPTDEERLERIRNWRRQQQKHEAKAEECRQKAMAEIHDAFPENRGEGESPRGWFTSIVKAAEWTRAHVTNVRDGHIEDGKVIPADPRKPAAKGATR